MRSYLSVFFVLVQTCFGHPIYRSPRHGFTTIGSGFSPPDPYSRLRFPEYGLRTQSPQSIFLGGGLRTYDTGFRPSDQGFNYLATRSRSPDVASLTVDRGSITHEQPYVGQGYNFQRESRRGTRADSVFLGRTSQRYNIGGTSYYARPMQANYFDTFEQTSPMQTNNANPFQQVIPTTVRRDSHQTTRGQRPRTQRQRSPGDSQQTINYGNTFDGRFEQTSLMQTNHDTPFHQSRPTTVRRDSHQTTRRQRPRTQRQGSPGDSQQTINHENTFNGRLAQTNPLQTKHNNINEGRLQQARPTSVRRDSQQPTRRRMQRTQGQTRRRPGHHRQDNRIIREGYIGAYGGENGFTYMGGYCPGEECNDGGLSVGLENGIGTGSLEEFNNRRRTGRNEDRTLYEMFATGPGTQAA